MSILRLVIRCAHWNSKWTIKGGIFFTYFCFGEIHLDCEVILTIISICTDFLWNKFWYHHFYASFLAPIGDREARIQQSTSIVAAVVLALLGVCVLLFTVASVLVRLRPRLGTEDAEVAGVLRRTEENSGYWFPQILILILILQQYVIWPLFILISMKNLKMLGRNWITWNMK